jgi:hypothetical protein
MFEHSAEIFAKDEGRGRDAPLGLRTSRRKPSRDQRGRIGRREKEVGVFVTFQFLRDAPRRGAQVCDDLMMIFCESWTAISVHRRQAGQSDVVGTASLSCLSSS